ncbi:hypothetical protein RJT34_23874 [Clitoria ternatea]|uniref:Uncharacterized protein n=1 Tax=Clitoria ternatea TaxID=43366 RepID=A0AAN9FPT1_CLITE
MGNKNSAISGAKGGKGAKVGATEPHYVVSMQRKHTRKPEVVSLEVYTTEQHSKNNQKPLENDDTFSNYIQRTRYKIRSMSNVSSHDDERSNPAPTELVAKGANNEWENERDHFSEFIQNTKKKLRTVS